MGSLNFFSIFVYKSKLKINMEVSTNSLSNNGENILDIFISAFGISCVTSNENRNVLLHHELNIPIHSKTDFNLVESFFQQSELDFNSDNVDIIFESSEYQPIPSELYHNDSATVFYETIFGKIKNGVLLTEVLPKWGLHLVYLIPQKLGQIFQVRYPEAEIKHHIFLLLKDFIHKWDNAVYLNFRKNCIDLALVKDNELQLINSFDVKTPEDVCYFTLNTYEQFNLPINSYKLNIKQSKHKENEAIALLKQYISNINIQ